MKLRISQEAMTPTRPMMAIVRVEEAEASFFSSPPLVRYLKPPLMNIKKKARPAITTIIWRMLAKRHSKPWMVATSPWVTQRPVQVPSEAT